MRGGRDILAAMTESYDDWAGRRSEPRFTDWLGARAEPHWSGATGHRFTRELAGDALADAVFARYLVQDYVFIDALASLVGFAVGHAPGMPAKARLAGFLSVLTNEESSYFLRAFEALGVSEADWKGARRAPVTRRFAELLAETARTGGYDEIMAILVAIEWVYLAWAAHESDRRPSRFYYAEWITLHTDAGFRDFVEWMRGELDRIGPALPRAHQSRLAELFTRVCELEVAFFDAAYGEL